MRHATGNNERLLAWATIAALFLVATCGEVLATEMPHREVVKLHLNDPESARFRFDKVSERAPGVWCGEVNARNRMGGMAGFIRYVVYMPDPYLSDDEEWNYNMSQAFFDDGGDAFRSKWGMLCHP